MFGLSHLGRLFWLFWLFCLWALLGASWSIMGHLTAPSGPVCNQCHKIWSILTAYWHSAAQEHNLAMHSPNCKLNPRSDFVMTARGFILHGYRAAPLFQCGQGQLCMLFPGHGKCAGTCIPREYGRIAGALLSPIWHCPQQNTFIGKHVAMGPPLRIAVFGQ